MGFKPERVSKARENSGLSQFALVREMAKHLPDDKNPTPQSVSMWERGTTQPGAEYLWAFSKATGYDMEYFFGK